jgi:hypothetical protein
MFFDEDEERLNRLREQWRMYPGSAPGGSGKTGLMPSDSKGYAKMLEDQQWALNYANRLQGKGPMNLKVGPTFGSSLSGLYDAAQMQRANYLDAQDANLAAANYQDARRGRK